MTNYENIKRSNATLHRQDYKIDYKRRKIALKKDGMASIILIQFIVSLIFAAVVLCVKFIPALNDINFYLTGLAELDLTGVVFD
ncbi:MAG: hypothetical protein FWG51_06215, partial [Firmicutes bacterium]|nr:hypothetical protein [Bacillota bacterium]